MNNYKPFVSVVIPVEVVGADLRQAVKHLLTQTYQNFEIIIAVTKDNGERFPKTEIVVAPELEGRPAERRDLGAKTAKGEIIAFIDDDVYPENDWLEKAVDGFKEETVAAVGGPMVTPLDDSLLEKASGWVWASPLGSGGAGTYRCRPQSKRTVDDYPTANLLVRKSDFLAVGGFQTQYWPGEDTKLCLDLTKKLGKKIIYDPEVLVYHHRRALFIPHLRQIRGYGLHRGHFARILPETSRRLGYFLPSLFFLFILIAPLKLLIFRWFGWDLLFQLSMVLSIFISAVYFTALLLTGGWVVIQSGDWRLGVLVMPGIFTTHLYYGLMFLRGYFSKTVKRSIHPHFWQK